MSLLVKKFTEDAIIPTKAHSNDAGLDLYSIEDRMLMLGSVNMIDTGVGIRVPDGTYGRIAPRSGLSTKGLIVNGGVVDQGYTDHVRVILMNLGPTSYHIKKGDRIAQLIIEKIAMDVPIVEVSEFDVGTGCVRGTGGFGSTGK